MSILIKDVLHNNQLTDIYIQNNTFLKIGSNLQLSADTVINGKEKAILPPFYNTHCHSSMSILRGIGEDKPLFDWLNEDIWPIEATFEAEDIYTASRLAILEMIKSGTVFFADMYFHNEFTIKAVAEMGIRACISYNEMDNFDPELTKKEIAATEKFLNNPNPCKERIIKCISCHSVYTVSEELLKYSKQRAEKDNLFIQVHASETIKEVEECYQKYGMSPIERLSSLGLLNERTTLAHGVHLSEKDIQIIFDSGCYISTNPTSNLKLNSGSFMFDKLYTMMPTKITLGTDGASSNNNLSMIEAMKICSLSAKQQANSALVGKASDIFKVATQNGARSFNLNAGEIAEGKLADCILVDLSSPFMVPNFNIISNMVYSADSSCITDVICDGKLIMQDKMVKNEKEIIKSTQLLAEKIKNYKFRS